VPNRHHTFVRDEVLPSWWANAIQSVLSTLAENFRLVLVDGSTTQIVVPAGPGDDLAALSIDGRWRFVEANVTRAHPGGAAGVYDVFATTAENNIVNAPLPNTDLTDYTFDLAIVAHGAQPVAVPGDVDLWRLIGDLDWDGVKITRLTQRVGAPDIGHGVSGDFAISGALTVGGRAVSGPAVLAQRPVLDVGVLGQTRAGRALTVADFTSLGLAQPQGLFNLGDLTNIGTDGRALTNKGAVPFGKGITGAAAEAAVFAGSSAQALYIPDAGGGLDSFALPAGGTWGCWVRTAKRGADQAALSKMATTGAATFSLGVGAGNGAVASVGYTATGFAGAAGVDYSTVAGVSDIADDRWHFLVAMTDGMELRVYVDGVLEAAAAAAGPPYGSPGPLNIGARGTDAATVGNLPHYGRVDEAFVTAETLSEDQVRALYAIKLAHGLGSQPGAARVNVYRRRRGATFAVADFPATPLRLYNFTGGSYGDNGSNGVGLAGNFGGGFIRNAPGADGTRAGGQMLGGAHTGMQASDAGLPSGTNARSYGLWFKMTVASTTSMGLVAYGTMPSSRDVLFVNNGAIYQITASDQIGGSPVADGEWHLATVVIDNAAADGLRRKVYVDGALVASSTVLGALVLGGGGHFRIGSDVDASMMPFVGSMDGVFVTNYAMARDDVMRLYARGAQQLAASPKNAGDHVEGMDATSVYFIGDTLDPQFLVDIGVAA
jgi:hypothetical protein